MGIQDQELVEINGNYTASPNNIVGGLGGMIGQLMLVFNAIQKHYKTDEIDFTSAKIVQNFIFKFIDSQMKTDKMVMMVGKAYEDFLISLEKPLNLNEMRIMKEANYVRIYL